MQVLFQIQLTPDLTAQDGLYYLLCTARNINQTFVYSF